MKLHKLTCNPQQAEKLLSLGIEPEAILWHYFRGENWITEPAKFPETPSKICLPAWTKAELDAMIGPQFAKPDLWKDDRQVKAQNPHTYPIFTLNSCVSYEVGAQASAHALTYMLEEDFVTAEDANGRYKAIFLKHSRL